MGDALTAEYDYLASLQRQQATAWERVLAEEGLAPLDGGEWSPTDRLPRNYKRVMPQRVRMGGASESADQFIAWAETVGRECRFERRAQGVPSPATRRRVWELHATGMSAGDVAGSVGISRRKVKAAIALTKQEAGIPCPVVNPWRKDLGGRLQAEDKIKEADVAKQEVIEYALIELRRDFRIPGHSAVKNRLVPLTWHDGKVHPLRGVPHVGGIDIEFPTFHKSRKTTTVITVVWADIARVEREPEDWIPEAA